MTLNREGYKDPWCSTVLSICPVEGQDKLALVQICSNLLSGPNLMVVLLSDSQTLLFFPLDP